MNVSIPALALPRALSYRGPLEGPRTRADSPEQGT